MGNFTTRTNNMNQERFRRRPVKQMLVFVQTWNIFVLEQQDINRTQHAATQPPLMKKK